jgi:hypothetical protein
MPKLKNGWGFDGVLNLQDGQPWHLNYEFQGDYSGAGEGFDRPDVIGPLQYSKNPAQFLNLSAFVAPCTWGNPQGNDGAAPLGKVHPSRSSISPFSKTRRCRSTWSLIFAPSSLTCSTIPTSPVRSCRISLAISDHLTPPRASTAATMGSRPPATSVSAIRSSAEAAPAASNSPRRLPSS